MGVPRDASAALLPARGGMLQGLGVAPRTGLGFVVAATAQAGRCLWCNLWSNDARLQPIHGFVGPMQQFRGILAMVGIHGLADGNHQLLLLIADPAGQRYALANG